MSEEEKELERRPPPVPAVMSKPPDKGGPPKQAYLRHPGPGLYTVVGVGQFGKQTITDAYGNELEVKMFPELAVSESIAAQYATPEMKAEGWIVTRR